MSDLNAGERSRLAYLAMVLVRAPGNHKRFIDTTARSMEAPEGARMVLEISPSSEGEATDTFKRIISALRNRFQADSWEPGRVKPEAERRLEGVIDDLFASEDSDARYGGYLLKWAHSRRKAQLMG